MPSEHGTRNPFEPSRVEASEGADIKPPRRMSLLLVIPLVSVASIIAFCCTCIPIGGWAFGNTHPANSWKAMFADLMFTIGAPIIGGGVALLVGWLLWRWLRRPKEDD